MHKSSPPMQNNALTEVCDVAGQCSIQQQCAHTHPVPCHYQVRMHLPFGLESSLGGHAHGLAVASCLPQTVRLLPRSRLVSSLFKKMPSPTLHCTIIWCTDSCVPRKCSHATTLYCWISARTSSKFPVGGVPASSCLSMLCLLANCTTAPCVFQFHNR